MTDSKIFVEGGGDSRELQTRCREGFKKLLERSGLSGRLPRIVACGSRQDTFESFKTEHEIGKVVYVAMLVDSEDPVLNTEQPWDHLATCDGLIKPLGATDDQVFLMTTCMETWIIADRDALTRFFEQHKPCIRSAQIPSTTNLENLPRGKAQSALVEATKDCANAYEKNKKSFEALGNTNPSVLRTGLPAFARMERILKQNSDYFGLPLLKSSR